MEDFLYSNELTDSQEIQESKQKAIQYLESLGLKNVTSKRQEKNGTIMFRDELALCDYGIYANGYVRRIYIHKPRGYSKYHRGNMYQLNKKKLLRREFDWGGYGAAYRILSPGNYFYLAQSITNAIDLYLKREHNGRAGFQIQTGKYKGMYVDGKFTSRTNVKTVYGNFYFEPETIKLLR